MAAILIVIGYFAVILSITILSMKLVKTKIIRTLFIGLGLLPSIQLIIQSAYRIHEAFLYDFYGSLQFGIEILNH